MKLNFLDTMAGLTLFSVIGGALYLLHSYGIHVAYAIVGMLVLALVIYAADTLGKVIRGRW